MDNTAYIMPIPPVNVEGLNSLLGQCVPDNFRPLKNRTILNEEEKEKPELAFHNFVQIIAYPIQSYQMKQSEKLGLFQHCRRLYPDEMGKDNVLKEIFKRIVCEPLTPIGLDLIKPKGNPPPSLLVRNLLGEQLSFIDPRGKEAIGVSTGHMMLQLPLERRQEEIASLWNRPNMEVEELHYTLNLLYFERELISSIWSLCEAVEAGETAGRELFSINPYVRVSSSMYASTLKPSHDFETIEGIAFAIQYNQILEKWKDAIQKFHQLSSLKISSSNESTALSIYSDFRKLSTEIKNTSCKKLELFFKKELFYRFSTTRLERIGNIHSQYSKNHLFVSALDRMRGAGEDSIAPFNTLMLRMMKKQTESILNSIQNFCISENLLTEQELTDFKALCIGYRDHFQTQKKLYDSLFKKLNEKVKSKRKQIEYRKYFNKLFIFSSSESALLPPELPEFFLPEFDPTLGLFEMLSKHHNQIEQNIHNKGSFAIVEGTTSKQKIANRRELKKAVVSKKRGGKHLKAAIEADPDSEEEEITSILTQPLGPMPSSRPIFSYAPRVERWFQPFGAFDRSSFQDYQNVSEFYFEKMRQLHAFSQTVDKYVKQLGLKSTWINRRTNHLDTNYILPGQMQVAGEIKRGVFVYCLGKDDILYHRFFSEKSPEDFIEKIVQKTFLDIDFPELENATDCELKSPVRKFETFSLQDEEITLHPILGIVTITHRITRSTISLFPVRPCF